MGAALYGVLFEEFREPTQRQEVVGSLVTHVGSGVGTKPGAEDAALSVFCGIAEKKARGKRHRGGWSGGASAVHTVPDEHVGSLACRGFVGCSYCLQDDSPLPLVEARGEDEGHREGGGLRARVSSRDDACSLWFGLPVIFLTRAPPRQIQVRHTRRAPDQVGGVQDRSSRTRVWDQRLLLPCLLLHRPLLLHAVQVRHLQVLRFEELVREWRCHCDRVRHCTGFHRVERAARRQPRGHIEARNSALN